MKTLIYVVIIVTVVWFISTRAIRAYFAQPATLTTIAAPMPTATPTTEPTATPQPTPTLAHGEAQRMRFAVGTYGGTYQAGTWSLWAAQGQTLTLAGDGMVARLTTDSGTDVPLIGDKATLPTSGDYVLTVAGVDQFSVDIR